MRNAKDSPRVYLPPPVIYISFFLVAVLIQHGLPLNKRLFYDPLVRIIVGFMLLAGLVFIFSAVKQFFKTKNTLITIKPASSLQTTGIYSISRNPMYISLMCFYLGSSLLFGNWWHLILFPVLFLTIQEYVIKREEQYLFRRFGELYHEYQQKVRRWL